MKRRGAVHDRMERTTDVEHPIAGVRFGKPQFAVYEVDHAAFGGFSAVEVATHRVFRRVPNGLCPYEATQAFSTIDIQTPAHYVRQIRPGYTISEQQLKYAIVCGR